MSASRSSSGKTLTLHLPPHSLKIAGIAFGLLVNALLGQVGIDYSKFASMTEYTALISGKVYSTLGVENLLQRGIVVLIVAIIAALYPAREAARNEPAKSLHFV